MFFPVRLVFLELRFVDVGEETDALEKSVHHLRLVLVEELLPREHGRFGREFGHSLNRKNFIDKDKYEGAQIPASVTLLKWSW